RGRWLARPLTRPLRGHPLPGGARDKGATGWVFPPSWPGLTRPPSWVCLADGRSGWVPGSSPGMTTAGSGAEHAQQGVVAEEEVLGKGADHVQDDEQDERQPAEFVNLAGKVVGAEPGEHAGDGHGEDEAIEQDVH